jgi:hypothetical protein
VGGGVNLDLLGQQRLVDILSGGLEPLSAQERALLEQTYGFAESEASRNVQRFADELAGARGLRTTDTPIGSVALEERARLSRGIQSDRAQQELAMAQARRQLMAELGLGQQAFAEGQRQFTTGASLQQQQLGQNERNVQGQLALGQQAFGQGQMEFQAGLATQQQAFQQALQQFQQQLRLQALQNRAAVASGLGAQGGQISLPNLDTGNALSAGAGLFGTLQSGRNQAAQLASAQNLAGLSRQTSLDVANIGRQGRDRDFIDYIGPAASLLTAGTGAYSTFFGR